MAVLLFIFMVALITLGVSFRYFFHAPLNWTDEYAMYTLVWVTFIGGSMSIKKNKASAMTFVVERIPVQLSKKLILLGTFLTFAFCLFILYVSLQWITNPLSLTQKSPVNGMPMIIPYAAIPLGFLFMTIHALDIFTGSMKLAKGKGI